MWFLALKPEHDVTGAARAHARYAKYYYYRHLSFYRDRENTNRPLRTKYLGYYFAKVSDASAAVYLGS